MVENNLAKFVFVASLALCVPAYAETTDHKCRPAAEWRSEVETSGGKIEALKGSQFNFLRGISAMHPNTPQGLPYGEAAELVTTKDSATVVFLDDFVVCDPISLPAPLVEMLKDVGEGKILHQGSGM